MPEPDVTVIKTTGGAETRIDTMEAYGTISEIQVRLNTTELYAVGLELREWLGGQLDVDPNDLGMNQVIAIEEHIVNEGKAFYDDLKKKRPMTASSLSSTQEYQTDTEDGTKD